MSRQAADATVIGFVESLAQVAIAVYDVVAERALLSADLATVATIYQGHHREHAEALAALDPGAVGGAPNATLFAELQPGLAELADQGGAVSFLGTLERRLAATQAQVLATVTDADAITTIGAAAPIAAAHATVWSMTLGSPPGDAVPPDAVFADPATGYDQAIYGVGG